MDDRTLNRTLARLSGGFFCVVVWLIAAYLALRFALPLTLERAGPVGVLAAIAVLVPALAYLALGLFRLWRGRTHKAERILIEEKE